MEFTASVIVLPDGMAPDDTEARNFGINVEYKGHYERRSAEDQGVVPWYAVTWRGQELSRGGAWSFSVQRFQRWQHRFTLEEALSEARARVNELKIGPRGAEFTWAQWSAQRDTMSA